jgi:hypothetical protein
MYADGCIEFLILPDSVLGFFKTAIFHPNVIYRSYGDGDRRDDGSFAQEQIGLGSEWKFPPLKTVSQGACKQVSHPLSFSMNHSILE